jgi:hypothetical protein
MDASELSSSTPPDRQDRWLVMLAGSVVLQLLPFLCPRFSIQPSPGWVVISAALLLFLLPFIFGVFLIALRRTTRERVVSYVALLASLFWLWQAWILIFFTVGQTHGR